MKMHLPPGGLIVVGPNGYLKVTFDQQTRWESVNCDFVFPDGAGMSDAHKAIVNERWALRTESGEPIQMPRQIHYSGAMNKIMSHPPREWQPKTIEVGHQVTREEYEAYAADVQRIDRDIERAEAAMWADMGRAIKETPEAPRTFWQLTRMEIAGFLMRLADCIHP